MPHKYQHTIKLPKNSILVRGVNLDNISNFADPHHGYFILLNNRPVKEIRKGIDFIRQYGEKGGYEFYQTKRHVALLNLPYSVLDEFNPNEKAYQKWVTGSYSELTKTLSEMLESQQIDVSTFAQYSSSLHAFFCMSDWGVKQPFKESHGMNMDYDVDKIVCASGYAGWMRKSCLTTDSDEIMICPRVRQTLLKSVHVDDILEFLDDDIKSKVFMMNRISPSTHDSFAAEQLRRQVSSPVFSSLQMKDFIQLQNQKLRKKKNEAKKTHSPTKKV